MSHLRVADDITELVGETPMLQFKRLVPPGSADVFAKLEYLNPGGSVKDRAAIGIIKRAEAEGKLHPGGTIVEATAGNTGIRSEERRVGKECRYWRDWSSDVCSSDLNSSAKLPCSSSSGWSRQDRRTCLPSWSI